MTKTKEKLKFKVAGGLGKLSDFYAGTGADAAETYFNNPAALLEALEVAPAKEIRISSGYKKLADSMEEIDFGLYHSTFSEEGVRDCSGVNLNVLTSLWNTVGGDCAVQAGPLKKDFNDPIVAVAVSMITVAVAFVNLSGMNEDKVNRNVPQKKPPGGPAFASREQLHQMAHHAQIVADHISWFS